MKILLLYAAVCIAVLTSCGSSSSKGHRKKGSSIDDVLVFKKHKTIDQEGTGEVAATCLIPDGWAMEDRLYWEYKDPTVPIRYKGLMQIENGKMQIQVFPDARYVWYTGPSGTQGARPPKD